MRPRWHAPEKSGPSLALSILAHVLLFASIAFVVRWKTEPAATVSAELWGGLPPVATSAPAAEPPRPAPVVEPPAPPKADIVETKAPEPVRKVEPPKLEKKEAPKKPEAKPAPKADPKADALKREAADRAEKAAQAKAAETQRQAVITRARAAAGGTPGAAPGTSSGGEPGLARGYEALVIGCIRPKIGFPVPAGLLPKQHVAEFEVQLLPTGEHRSAPRRLKASGLDAYDNAVENAILGCNPFPPLPGGGSVPSVLRLSFDPVELR